MGSLVSKAADGVGSLVGNAFAAPLKAVFGGSCNDVCPDPWDLICLIEHLCVVSLVKLLLMFILTYFTLLFVYLLCKLGIIPCMVKGVCKMGWACCETYWYAMEDISCFLWHKLRNTKRVYRRRRRRRLRRDIEEGQSSFVEDDITDDDSGDEFYGNSRIGSRRRSVRERRKDQMRMSLYPVRHRSSKYRRGSRSQNHDVQWRTSELSVNVKEGSNRKKNAKHLQVVRNGGIGKRKVRFFKKRRVR
ncbi:hypothetical protein Sjap_023064 [Stephania japonica]|uniref:Uncharacterized protein n=1 Tax=Stephania japonica TaxID=461633 RepID=A0AAP0ET34_9MAGN